MIIKISSILSLLGLYTISFGQSFKSKNYLVIEFGGHGAFYSFNYERLIVNNDLFKTSGQLGLTYYYSHKNNRDYLTFGLPIQANQILFKKSHHAELGMGTLVTYERLKSSNDYELNAFLTFKIGYRFQNANKPIFYKIAFTPVFNFQVDQQLFNPWAMVGIGYQFCIKEE
jgi:hypothetical protein